MVRAANRKGNIAPRNNPTTASTPMRSIDGDPGSLGEGGEKGECGDHRRSDGEALGHCEVGTVGREKAQERAGLLNRRAHLGLLVGGEIVEHDDIARAQRRHQDLLDIGAEAWQCRSAHRTRPSRSAPSGGAPRPPCASASGCTACDPQSASRAGCGRSGVTDPWSRRIRRRRRTGAHRAAAASRATGAARPRHQGDAVRRRVPFPKKLPAARTWPPPA